VFTGRSVIEIVELLFAFTVCVSLLLIGVGLVVLALVRDEATAAALSGAAGFLRDSLVTLLAALLGLLAGRGMAKHEQQKGDNA